MTHPEFEILLGYINQQLDEDAHSSLEQHLTICSECRKQLALAHELMANLPEQPIAPPQAALVRRAVAAFRQFHKRHANRLESTATLLFDSWDSALPAGVRGHSTERQLLYHFADLDVDLQITPEGEPRSYRLQGQILREETDPELLEGIAIKLMADGHRPFLRRAIADHLGRFYFSQIPDGYYRLQIELHDTSIHVGTLALDSG